MKKRIVFAVLLMFAVVATNPIFAMEEKELNYVEGLGYEVEIDTGSVSDYITAISVRAVAVAGLSSYDSGWKNYLGGEWRHGVGSKYVWSHFDHKTKVHKTSVKGKGDMMSYSGWTEAGKRASASWEKALWGNKAYADVK